MRLIGAASVALLLLTASCSSDDESSSETTEPEACAWAVRGGKDVLNIAYPDTAATYWAIGYDLAEGEQIELHGRFASARYSSLTTYGPVGGVIDTLADQDITPETSNDESSYIVAISETESELDEPNTLGARVNEDTELPAAVTSTSSDDTQPTDPDDPAEVNRLGSGDGDGVRGSALYRVYLPDDRDDPTGGVGLPEVAIVSANGERHSIPTCEESGPSDQATQLVETYGPATDRPAPPQPIFVRPDNTMSNNLFPVPANVYIATIVEHRAGQIVVVRGTAPADQVRYWSLCTNEYRKPYPVSFCTADEDVVTDDGGRYTFVVSTPDERPANATEENGITWLEWGSTEVNNLLLMRHMLPDPATPESAANLAPGALARSSMGPYAPVGTYCDKVTFEQSGADACPWG